MARHVICTIIALLSATFFVFSQTFRLDVHDEPLNKVLSKLGLEISFDDRALSAYRVTASKSFDHPEKALSWLLNDKPFRIEKMGKVYVIVPLDNSQRENTMTIYPPAVNERFIFRGTVVDHRTGEALEYATASLLSHDNQLLTAGISTNNGRFTIHTTRLPAKIKISYIGYETLLSDIVNLDGELGVFALNETVIALGEAVITAENLPGINRSVYAVTPEMRHGADHALELLDKIPGASFDKSSMTARLNNHSNILLLVDGIQQSHAYLNHLLPSRIQAIEVVYALSGRFVSDDYAGIIHFILKKDYTGYDIHASSTTSLNLSKTAGHNRLTENHPSVGITYTTRKLNFFSTFRQNRENRQMLSSKTLTYSGYELTSLSSPDLNNRYNNAGYFLTGGLNYHIKPLQLIGVQVDYTSGQTKTFQEHVLRRTDSSSDYDRLLTNTTENRIDAYACTGSLFYQGQVSNRLHLYGDFSYNYYYNDMENEYRQDEPVNYRYFDVWDEHKKQTILNVEGRYKLSGAMTLEAGYSNIWRLYASESSQGRGFLDYSEQRNKFFGYHTWTLSEKAGLKSGVALEHIRQRSREDENSYLRILPFLLMNYKISPRAHVSIGYTTNQSYPSLEQLSPISIVVDTFLTQIGNPVLKSAMRSQVFAEIRLWNKLKIMPMYSFVTDGVSETYDQRDFRLYRTFANVKFREYSLFASHDQMLGAHLRLKNTVVLYRSEALFEGVSNAINGWTFQSEADYYHPRSSAGLQLGYYRLMKTNILWQGYQMSDRDYWCVTARKDFLNNRISAVLSYIPPLPFGIRYDRMKAIDTPLHKEKTTVNLESHNQMLLLKISIRLGRGSAKPVESRAENRTPERGN